MASPLPLLPYFCPPSQSLPLCPFRSLSSASRLLPHQSCSLKLLPLASIAPVHSSHQNLPSWKGPVSFETVKQHALLLYNRWSQHNVEETAFPVQLSCTTHDTLCTFAVFAGSLLWVRLFEFLVQKGVLDQKLSRKLAHISTGIVFASTWPLYSSSPWARLFALAIPLATVMKLILNGLNIVKDEGTVKSLSREGSPVELLRGPLYYVLILCLCTVAFWRDSPVGTIALAIMCGGDGIADIVGRRFGAVKLPYNPSKSWAGSIAMFFFGFLLSIGFLYYYTSLGFYRVEWRSAIQSLALILAAATLVESLPIDAQIDDNLSVPLVSIALGLLFFPIAKL